MLFPVQTSWILPKIQNNQSHDSLISFRHPHYYPHLHVLYVCHSHFPIQVEKTKDLNVEYFVIGMGVQRSYLEQQKAEKGLDKLHVLDYQPRHLMPSILAYSDVQFIFMAPEMEMMGFPSKVYTIMACERPLLICSGDKTPIVNFTKDYNCAKLITEKDFDKKVDEMAQWLASVSREELQKMGRNGYDVIQRYYTKEKVTKQYVDLVNKIL